MWVAPRRRRCSAAARVARPCVESTRVVVQRGRGNRFYDPCCLAALLHVFGGRRLARDDPVPQFHVHADRCDRAAGGLLRPSDDPDPVRVQIAPGGQRDTRELLYEAVDEVTGEPLSPDDEPPPRDVGRPAVAAAVRPARERRRSGRLGVRARTAGIGARVACRTYSVGWSRRRICRRYGSTTFDTVQRRCRWPRATT